MKTFDLTVIITSFHSRDKIFSCIDSIEKSIKIIVIENSNDERLKEEIHSKYQNVECILSKENLGYGAGNNLGLSKVETSYALIVNPDVTLNNDAVNKFFLSINNLKDFKEAINLNCNIIKIYPIKSKDSSIDILNYKNIDFIAAGGLSINDLKNCKSLGYKSVVIGDKAIINKKFDPKIFEWLKNN